MRPPGAQERESRPAGNGTATRNNIAGQATTTLAAIPSTGEDSTAAEFFRDSYAVLVRGKTVRRHLYFNLPAAERAMKRAAAQGDRASMVLVRLVPITGGEAA
ncbi:hypothetical protein [Georgenia sp. AZ-5]|uniref:hypothetical protein n=1 Tax=Georgenia sp. AZ-5 TaxID=3367526 RepID=UPI0037546514